jgi:hypothetical protein
MTDAVDSAAGAPPVSARAASAAIEPLSLGDRVGVPTGRPGTAGLKSTEREVTLKVLPTSDRRTGPGWAHPKA